MTPPSTSNALTVFGPGNEELRKVTVNGPSSYSGFAVVRPLLSMATSPSLSIVAERVGEAVDRPDRSPSSIAPWFKRT